MTTTGKAARRRHGTKVSAKQAKARRGIKKAFGSLPISAKRGNAAGYDAKTVATCDCALGCPGIRGGKHVPTKRPARGWTERDVA
jgi:hypothetical protein